MVTLTTHRVTELLSVILLENMGMYSRDAGTLTSYLTRSLPFYLCSLWPKYKQ
jgi:hypothetical protein